MYVNSSTVSQEMVKLTKSLYVNYILYNKFSHIGVAHFGMLQCHLVFKVTQTRISENKYIVSEFYQHRRISFYIGRDH